MVKVRVIIPLCDLDPETHAASAAELEPLEAFGIHCEAVTLGAGPASIEGHFDEALAAPFVAIEAMKAERDGIDAVVIDCMGDPGLMAAREVVSIPVIGPAEASMHMAALMGNRFSCVSILDAVRPIFHANARVYGVDKLASVRTINMPVLEIERNLDRLPDLLLEQSLLAIEQDLADTIILGCTGFLGVADRLEALLAERGYAVPVIRPMPTAVQLAALMVQGGMSHSRHAFHRPSFRKKYVGFPLPTHMVATGP